MGIRVRLLKTLAGILAILLAMAAGAYAAHLLTREREVPVTPTSVPVTSPS